jgi:Flp pilus assembly protein TadD
MEHFQKALQLNPDNAEANYNLANALVQKGRFEEAVTYYNHALRLNPGNAAARDRLNKVLQQLGR